LVYSSYNLFSSPLARHHLRFYDARVITVKQPSLSHIAKSLRDAFELSRITHQGSPELEKLNYEV
jgi:hypothetical protein